MNDKEKVIFCRNAFLVMDNLAFFRSNQKVGSAHTFIVVDTNSRRRMVIQISGDKFNVVKSSLSESSYYKALYYIEVNKKYIKREVLKNAKVY